MQSVDASTLGAFRILFGSTMLWNLSKYSSGELIHSQYIARIFYFTYPFFDSVNPLEGNGMYYCFGVMGLAALFLTLGLFYRLAAIIFFLTYTYVFLIDNTNYNNHYYLICLLSFLFCFVQGNRWMSLDAMWRPGIRTGVVPKWNLFILKAQIFIVYFYSGLAKINKDWLSGEPMRLWLNERGDTPLFGQLLDREIIVYIFSYGALVFDLLIGFLLINKNTRVLGIMGVIIFNMTNQGLFHIGIFPFLMICSTILFLEPEIPRKWLSSFLPNLKVPDKTVSDSKGRFQKPVLAFVSIYLVLQILLPLRHFLYTGNTMWTSEGHHFAWRMKLRSKRGCRIVFIAKNPATGETWPIDIRRNLTPKQISKMCSRPNMILQYAHYLGDELTGQGYKNPIVTVRSSLSMNSRPVQALIDPEINLLEKEYSIFQHSDWIVPLKKR
jgi:vitamin K-dependent gamma-carboxylase